MSELPAKSLGRVCPNFKVLVETPVYLNIFYMLCESHAAVFYSSPQRQGFRGISIIIMRLMSFVHLACRSSGRSQTSSFKLTEEEKTVSTELCNVKFLCRVASSI